MKWEQEAERKEEARSGASVKEEGEDEE
jgi:hypothetical protein